MREVPAIAFADFHDKNTPIWWTSNYYMMWLDLEKTWTIGPGIHQNCSRTKWTDFFTCNKTQQHVIFDPEINSFRPWKPHDSVNQKELIAKCKVIQMHQCMNSKVWFFIFSPLSSYQEKSSIYCTFMISSCTSITLVAVFNTC